MFKSKKCWQFYKLFVEKTKWEFTKTSLPKKNSFPIPTKWIHFLTESSHKSNPRWSSSRMPMLISDVVMPSVEQTNNKKEETTVETHPQPKSSIWLMPSDTKKLLSTSLDSQLTSRSIWKSYWLTSKLINPTELTPSRTEEETSSSGLWLTSMSFHSTPVKDTTCKTWLWCLTIRNLKMKPQPSFTLWMDWNPTKYDL